MNQSGDRVLVVGAGHIGIACAHYLVEAGHEVTVIDQGEIGGACSLANCGFIVPSHVLPLTEPATLMKGIRSLPNPKAPFRVKPQLRPELYHWLLQFARRCTHERMLQGAAALKTILDASAYEYRQLFANPELDAAWKQSGMLFVFLSPVALRAFGKDDELLSQEFDLKAKHLAPDELAAFEPALRDDLAGAWYYEHDSFLQPDRLNASWANWLGKRGARFIEGCQLEQIEISNGKVHDIVTSQGPMSADHYVFAIGAWSSLIADALGCSIPVEPGKGYSVTMSKPESMPSHPMLFPERSIGITPFEDSYRIASMMEFAGFDTTIPEFRIRQLQDSARPYLRDPVGAEIRHTWYGWRPMTWDSLPIIGRVPRVSNALLATGHNMLGLTLAPTTGRLIAELVAERTPHIPVEPYSPARF
jgi:D-amino-acid dehydrogenase